MSNFPQWVIVFNLLLIANGCGQMPGPIQGQFQSSMTPIEKTTDDLPAWKMVAKPDFSIVSGGANIELLSQLCLESDNNKLRFSPCSSTTAQQFSWGNQGQIRVNDLGCLSLVNQGQTWGVHVATCSDFSLAQRWVIRYGNIRNESAIVDPNQTFCLHRSDSSQVTISNCLVNDSNQRFELWGNVAEEKGFLVRTSERNDKCLSVGLVPALPYQNAPVVIRQCEMGMDQAWRLEQGQLRIGDLCLGLLGPASTSTSLGMVSCDSTKFLWDMDAGLLRLVLAGANQPTNFCADIWDGTYQDGNKVGIYVCTATNSHQQWRLGR